MAVRLPGTGAMTASAAAFDTLCQAAVMVADPPAGIPLTAAWNCAAEDMDAMMEFYGDYRIVADSAGIECPADVSRVALVSQITALLVTCAWTGTL